MKQKQVKADTAYEQELYWGLLLLAEKNVHDVLLTFPAFTGSQ